MSAAAVPTRVPRIDRSMSSSQQRITPLFLGQKGAAQSAAGCPAVRSRNNMWPTRDEAARTACAPGLGWTGGKPTRFFYFYIFYFRFLQKYIFDFEIYINISRPPGSRAAGTWPPGSRAAGANLQKKIQQKIADRSLGTGRPAAGRTALFFAI